MNSCSTHLQWVKTTNQARKLGAVMDSVSRKVFENRSRIKGPASQRERGGGKLGHAFISSPLEHCNGVFTVLCERNKNRSDSWFRTALPPPPPFYHY